MKLNDGLSFAFFFLDLMMPDTELMILPKFGSEPDVLPETTTWCGNTSPDAEVEARQVN